MTHINQIMDVDKLDRMIAEGYIRAKKHDEMTLTLYNYSEKATYERNWTNETMECRGLVVAEDGTVVARPFRKFFNFTEEAVDQTKLKGPVEVTDKLDGSMGVWWRWNGKSQISTRGSFKSDQAVWATGWLHENFPQFSPPQGLTPIFEIVYPENRIVLDYGQFAGLVLLGYRAISSGQLYGPEWMPDHWHGQRAEVFSARTLDDAMALPDRENAEGIVVRFTHWGYQVKLKQEDYVRAHAVVTNMTNRSVWNFLAMGEDLPEASSFMPDEFLYWLRKTEDDLRRQHFALCVKVKLVYDAILEDMRKNGEYMLGHIGEYCYHRKPFAMRALEHDYYKAALFQLYDGKDISGWAWAQLRPETIERPWTGGAE